MRPPRTAFPVTLVTTGRRFLNQDARAPRSTRRRLVLFALVGFMLSAALGALSLATNSAPARAAQGNQVIVRAEGTNGTEQMELVVNGERVAEWIVGASAADYVYTPTETVLVDTVEVHFVNDLGVTRDLRVEYVDVGGVVLHSNDPATISTGTFSPTEGCTERNALSTTLHCAGSFTYAVPDGTLVESTPVASEVPIVVRALGATGAEQIQVRVNDETLATETLTTDFDDFTYLWPAEVPIERVEVAFVNDRGPRDVRIDYVEVDQIRYESEDENTFSTGAFQDGECTARFDGSEWLRCDGSFVYAIGGAPVPLPQEDVASDDDVASGGPADPVEPQQDELPEPDQGTEISVRALGTTGQERIEVQINGDVLATERLTTSFQVLTYEWPADVEITSAQVEFVNDAGPRNVRVDYVEIDDVRYESEEASTFNSGSFFSGSCRGAFGAKEWLYCDGAFVYPVNGELESLVPDRNDASNDEPDATNNAEQDSPGAESSESSDEPLPRQVGSGSSRYSIAQVIDGTIGSGDGSNPNEESPMGRHDARLSLDQGWNWAQGPTRNSVWGQLGSGGSRFAEFRCAVIPELGHTPPVPFRVNVREGAYYQFLNGNWQTGFDVDLTGGNHGGYLGNANQSGGNPFNAGSKGLIEWRREADGSFSAPWNPNALMMHFWAGQRKAPANGQTAEFLTSELRLQQPDGQTVDLSRVKVLFQCGIDYYSTTGGQGTQVPGPGIGKYHRATPQWQPSLWVTLPRNAPAGSVADFRSWLNANTPPNVG